MLTCPVCSEDLNDYDKYCPRCGTNLNKPEDLTVDAKKSGAKQDIKKETINAQAGKIFPNTKLLYLLIALFFIGSLIIFSSGIFDNSVQAGSAPTEGAANPHAGVDLNSLNEITELEKTVDANPNDRENLLKLAHLLNDSGFKAKAIDRYNQYLKLDPKNPDVLVDLGVCYYETGSSSDAIASMEKAIKINPRHQIANLNLGIVNSTIGNTAKAVEYWKTAIEIDPANEIGKKAQELIKQH